MKKNYVYIVIIGIMSISLGISVAYNFKMIKESKTNSGVVSSVICQKNNLTDNQYTFDDKYELKYNSLGKLERVKNTKIYNNISENNYIDISKKIEENENGPTGYVCNYLNDSKKLTCYIETNTFKDTYGTITNVWYYTYMKNLESDGYICKY